MDSPEQSTVHCEVCGRLVGSIVCYGCAMMVNHLQLQADVYMIKPLLWMIDTGNRTFFLDDMRLYERDGSDTVTLLQANDPGQVVTFFDALNEPPKP